MVVKQHVLILCTGNSCRSQMAEGLVNHFLGDKWVAFSAGTRPSGTVHPLAIRAMAELDIDISHHTSQHTDAFRNENFDVVLTVCDNAAEDCPVWLGHGRKQHLPFPDPAHATGTAEEQMPLFRHVRDAIRTQLLPWLENMDHS